jgi:phosphoribosylaminoimidazole-succinocarboxamide synthase
LFAKGQDMAAKRNLYLADTKYEFGKIDGKIIVIDEIHTPDSSRYFYLDSYRAYLKDRKEEPKHLSKEFVREWLMENGFMGNKGEKVPEMDDEIVNMISERYIELYEEMTGEKFVKPGDKDPLKRIETNVLKALEK